MVSKYRQNTRENFKVEMFSPILPKHLFQKIFPKMALVQCINGINQNLADVKIHKNVPLITSGFGTMSKWH